MARHDDRHAATMARANSRHAGLTGDAARAYDKVVEPAGVELAKAQDRYDRLVAEADARRRAAEQAAHAEKARAAKAALAEWTKAEREDQGVPAEAFIRLDGLGRFHVHAAVGVPAVAVAQSHGHDLWAIDDDEGRAFVAGNELVMRRRLFAAMMRPQRESTPTEPEAA